MTQKKRVNKPIQIALTEDQIANIIREAARSRKGLKAESLEERIAPSRFGLPVFGGAESGLPGGPEGDSLPPTNDPVPLPGTDGQGTPGAVGGGSDGLSPQDPIAPPGGPAPFDPNNPTDPNDPFGNQNPYQPHTPPGGAPYAPDDPAGHVYGSGPNLPADPNFPNDPNLPQNPNQPLGGAPYAPDDPNAPINQPGFDPLGPGDGPVVPGFEHPPGGYDGVNADAINEFDRQLHDQLQQRLQEGGDIPSPEEIREHRENIIRQLRGEG